ncbi:acyl transferase domain-containing protein [Breoghania corrubedonensis]|uniref:Acyl transferase domain-containing protein n=1 Tax=Breoghania corrubedonensis TaxID=665038 RepID=A0A2T5V8X5_9HYPH|nr:type I polyketide synthase [Breoghania corrubedonensis]PTW60203.1 acyl transferase domain-containing protein [Breoghania corrubedonensis]
MTTPEANGLEIAIVGMSCRFPDADTPESFWQNIVEGRESIRRLSDVDLAFAGVDRSLWDGEDYVRYGSRLDKVAYFDAEFFAIPPREAAAIDPQQRLFLESAWHALEASGYAARCKDVAVGVYGGVGPNTYMAVNVGPGRDFEKDGLLDSMEGFQLMLGNDKDYLATRVAYKLGLNGPALDIQTACSTSLVAIHLACRGLQTGECDLALAGGANIVFPDGAGYTRQDGMIMSDDGHCRPFDAKASGTVFGSGVGVLALRRLEDALADNDTIHAVIKGSAINNDGADKASFSAPSIKGQAGVVADALAAAEVDPNSITYLETHGTATRLGDPIEIEALSSVFGARDEEAGPIAIGSVKANIGHLIAAAGVAGVIKTVEAIKAKTLPPNINFDAPNSEIEFDRLPFAPITEARPWLDDGPRRAGVSSFGVGGTNAHLILEEAPIVEEPRATEDEPAGAQDWSHVLALSARSPAALKQLANETADLVERTGNANLGAICFTAGTARRPFEFRLAASGRDAAEIIAALKGAEIEKASSAPLLAAMFTGQGGQHEGMGRGLYETEPVFRAAMERCSAILEPDLEHRLTDVLYHDEALRTLVHDTTYTQPALFAVEYALYELWQSRGVSSEIVLGHSVGEYVAATVAGVFSLEDGLRLIARRGRLMGALPRNGAMASITAGPDRVREILTESGCELSVAAQNGPLNTVVSGLESEIEKLERYGSGREIPVTRLKVSHAFHSMLMDPVLAEFEDFAQGVAFHPPRLTMISNVTGEIAGDAVASPKYWTDHIRNAVLFRQCLESARRCGATVFLEMGAHPVLSGLAQTAIEQDEEKVSFVGTLKRGIDDRAAFAAASGRLFCAGVSPEWRTYEPARSHRVVAFPRTPYQRKRHWIEAGGRERPQWHNRRRWVPLADRAEDPGRRLGRWLVVGDPAGLGGSLAQAITDAEEGSGASAVLDPAFCFHDKVAIAEAVETFRRDGSDPIAGVIFAPGQGAEIGTEVEAVASTGARKLMNLAHLQQVLCENENLADTRIWIVGRGGHASGGERQSAKAAAQVRGMELQSAMLHGMGLVLQNEYPQTWGGSIDLAREPEPGEAAAVLDILRSASAEAAYAVRAGEISVLRVAPVPESEIAPAASISPDRVYLVTGASGALARQVADWLVASGARHLFLISRSAEKLRQTKWCASLASAGISIEAASANVADEAVMRDVFAKITAHGVPLGGIVHTAGIVEDQLVSGMRNDSALRRTLVAKLEGTLVLDRLSRQHSPDFFICFSSVSALLGMKGQAAYVAANSAMNRIVEGRNRAGLPGLSIEWGPWVQAGMAASLDEKFRKRLGDFGILGIENAEGIRKLAELSGTNGVISSAPIIWGDYAKKQYGEVPKVLSELSASRPDRAAPNGDEGVEDTMLAQLSRLAADERTQAIGNLLRDQIAKVLGADPQADLAHDVPLNRMGFDSLATIEFRNALSRSGLKISLQKLVMGASVNDLIADIEAQAETEAGPASPAIMRGDESDDTYDKSCVIIPKPRPDAKVRLIGFPYAGGGPLVFQSWVDRLPDHIELGILQLPGRSARLKEDFYTRMEDFVEGLMPDIVPFLDKPFAFFGHCVGGVQSFEIAQRVRRDLGLQPVHMFVAGGRSPQIYNDDQFAIDVQQFNHETGKAEHELEEEDFVEMLREVNFANNKALFEDKEMREMMLPIIQADYEINNYYRYGSHPPLDTPITVIGGRIDPYVTGEHLYGWQDHTTADFKSYFCSGDHYFMEHQADLLVRIACEALPASKDYSGAAQSEKINAA